MSQTRNCFQLSEEIVCVIYCSARTHTLGALFFLSAVISDSAHHCHSRECGLLYDCAAVLQRRYQFVQRKSGHSSARTFGEGDGDLLLRCCSPAGCEWNDCVACCSIAWSGGCTEAAAAVRCQRGCRRFGTFLE